VPFHRRLEVLPELGIIPETQSYKIKANLRAGWIFVVLDGKSQKIAFRFTGNWNREMLLMFQHHKLATEVMLALHRGLMNAKVEHQLIGHFQIKGMCFDSHTGFNTEYRAY
jgi:hypothetical protein